MPQAAKRPDQTTALLQWSGQAGIRSKHGERVLQPPDYINIKTQRRLHAGPHAPPRTRLAAAVAQSQPPPALLGMGVDETLHVRTSNGQELLSQSMTATATKPHTMLLSTAKPPHTLLPAVTLC